MSERVNIEQVREVANKPIAPLEQVWRDMLNDMANEIERLRVAMIFIMQDVDGFAGVSRDRYDFASQVADERGITGAIPVECELEGFLRMIEQANTGGNDEQR